MNKFNLGYKLGRLSCAIESEGNISLSYRKDKKNQKIVQLIPLIKVVNKEKLYIKNLYQISKYFNIKCNLNKQKDDIYIIVWMGMKRVLPLLKIIYPYLIIKKKQARYLIKFINYRKSLSNKKLPYRAIERNIFFKIRNLNGIKFIDKKLKKFLIRNPYEYTQSYISNQARINSLKRK